MRLRDLIIVVSSRRSGRVRRSGSTDVQRDRGRFLGWFLVSRRRRRSRPTNPRALGFSREPHDANGVTAPRDWSTGRRAPRPTGRPQPVVGGDRGRTAPAFSFDGKRRRAARVVMSRPLVANRELHDVTRSRQQNATRGALHVTSAGGDTFRMRTRWPDGDNGFHRNSFCSSVPDVLDFTFGFVSKSTVVRAVNLRLLPRGLSGF